MQWISAHFSPHVPQDSLRQKTERIEELEEALRESVQITAEREMVLAQEEAARSLQEKQVYTHTPPQTNTFMEKLIIQSQDHT